MLDPLPPYPFTAPDRSSSDPVELGLVQLRVEATPTVSRPSTGRGR